MTELKRLISTVDALRKNAEHYASDICELLNISPDASDPRRGCFVLVCNSSILTLELLRYYHYRWSNPPAKFTDKEKRERCMMVLKWLFIDSLSSIEYSAKASIASYPEDSPAKGLMKVEKGKYVYLRDIMRKSKKYDLIDANEYKDWENLNFLRNCIVHNNVISDRDKTIDIGGTRIIASADKMIQGNLDFFAVLIEVAIERYFAWVKALIKEYGNQKEC